MDRVGYVWVSMPLIWPDGEVVNLQVTQSVAETEEGLATLRTVLVIVTVVALIPAVISSRILANRMTKPIQQMTRTMSDIQASGHFKRLQLEEKSKDELNTMGQTFNRMMDLLESNFERQERFVSDASHELKHRLPSLRVTPVCSSAAGRSGLKYSMRRWKPSCQNRYACAS